MCVSITGARLVSRRFRRASWVFGFVSLTTLAYVGAYVEAILASVGFWGVFQLAALAIERAGELKKAKTKCP